MATTRYAVLVCGGTCRGCNQKITTDESQKKKKECSLRVMFHPHTVIKAKMRPFVKVSINVFFSQAKRHGFICSRSACVTMGHMAYLGGKSRVGRAENL